MHQNISGTSSSPTFSENEALKKQIEDLKKEIEALKRQGKTFKLIYFLYIYLRMSYLFNIDVGSLGSNSRPQLRPQGGLQVKSNLC